MANWWEQIKVLLRRAPGNGFLRLVYRLLRSGESRGVAVLEWRRPSGLFQPYPLTFADRYPVLFKLARERIGDGADRRILSFGCSTGEEVWSLRRYFQEAEIVGIDISPRNIGVCRRRLACLPDPRIRFTVAGTTRVDGRRSFADIFDEVRALDRGLAQEQFETQARALFAGLNAIGKMYLRVGR